METNESILTRSIVGLDERKVLGKMSSLRVDYDTQSCQPLHRHECFNEQRNCAAV